MLIRNRIKTLRYVPAVELRPNPLNWRTHSDQQRDVLRGVLAEVGYADALLARELPDGSLELIDGHLRAETTPDQLVPVLVLDVDAAEAAKLLATLDPLANLAGTNHGLLDQVLELAATDNAAVQQLWDELRALPTALTDEELAPLPEQRSAPRELRVPELYQLVVECTDEAEQEALYEELHGQGYKVRAICL